jgi:hypothetical protein
MQRRCPVKLHNNTICGNPAHWQNNEEWYCGRHKNHINNILCTYDPPLLLSDDIMHVSDNPSEQERIQKLHGYINIRISSPVFVDNGSISLVFMSQVLYEEEHFTKRSLAKEIANSVEYFTSRLHVYDNLSCYSTSDILLHSINYDYVTGLFYTEMSLV